MRCPKCGKENPDDRKTCRYCGADLKLQQDPALNRLILLTAVLLAVFIALAASELFHGKSPANNPSDGAGADQASDGAGGDAETGQATAGAEADPASSGKEADQVPDGTDAGQVSDSAGTAATHDGGATAGGNSGKETTAVHATITSLPDEFLFYNGHTYAFYDSSRYGFQTYEEVADFCRRQGGHLAVINDIDENSFLFNSLRDRSNITAYFGYSDEREEGKWEWADGESDFENWTKVGEWSLPDNGKGWGGDEDYAEFNYEKGKPGIPSDGTWNDAPFQDNTTTFICEWDFIVEQ